MYINSQDENNIFRDNVQKNNEVHPYKRSKQISHHRKKNRGHKLVIHTKWTFKLFNELPENMKTTF
jgi:hypothetical protein